jgi:flagellar hook protein FlgE
MSISIDANSALSSAFSGMQASARVLDRAASNIANSSVSASERSSLSSGLSSKADGVRESATFSPPSLTQNIVDVVTSQTLYTANAKVVEAVDGTIGTALNMLV